MRKRAVGEFYYREGMAAAMSSYDIKKFSGKSKTFWGWVPILSSELLTVQDPVIRIERIRKDWADTERTKDCEYADFEFVDSGYLKSFKVSMPETGFMKIEIDILPTGLFSFHYSYDICAKQDNLRWELDFLFPTIIYTIVRDIYHDHVHHERTYDAVLQVEEAKDIEDAMRKFRLQYENKIKAYHQDIKRVDQDGLLFNTTQILLLRPMLKRLKLMNLAIGEFVYAKSFLQLHGLSCKAFAFDNATNSVRLLMDKQYWRIATFFASLNILLVTVATLPIFKKIGAVIASKF